MAPMYDYSIHSKDRHVMSKLSHQILGSLLFGREDGR